MGEAFVEFVSRIIFIFFVEIIFEALIQGTGYVFLRHVCRIKRPMEWTRTLAGIVILVLITLGAFIAI